MRELADYKVVLYRQRDGSWVAYAPALPGCHAVMPERDAALSELANVFDMIRDEYQDEGRELPADVELIHG